jgi:type IV pilus assembly protein PilN
MILGINLATKPLETHRRFRVFSPAALAAAALLFALLAWHVYALRRAETAFRLESASTEKELNVLLDERERLDRFFQEPENAKLHDRASFINTIIDERSFNWTRMFMDLEKILPLGVHVISIEPKQVNGQASVKLTLGAANDEAKMKFLHALEQSGAFSHLQLANVRAPAGGESKGDQVIIELTVIYSRA